MKYFLIILALFTFTAPAFASNYGRFGPVHFKNIAYGGQGGKGIGIGTGYGGRGGDGGLGGLGGGGGSVNGVKQHRVAAFAYAPSIQATSRCRNPVNAGISAPMAGLSFGATYEDDQCDAREGLRVVGSLTGYGIYDKDDANALVKHATCKLNVYIDSPFCKVYLATLQPKKGDDNYIPPQASGESVMNPHAGQERTWNMFGLLD